MVPDNRLLRRLLSDVPPTNGHTRRLPNDLGLSSEAWLTLIIRLISPETQPHCKSVLDKPKEFRRQPNFSVVSLAHTISMMDFNQLPEIIIYLLVHTISIRVDC